MQNTATFSIGDIVKCIDDDSYDTLHVLRLYKVLNIRHASSSNNGQMVTVEPQDGGKKTTCFGHRFILMYKLPARHPNGRFKSANPVQALTKVLSNPSVTRTIARPKVLALKNGSLYRIVGGPVARLKGQVGNKDLYTFSEHGRFITVPFARIELASSKDVAAYLDDSKTQK